MGGGSASLGARLQGMLKCWAIDGEHSRSRKGFLSRLFRGQKEEEETRTVTHGVLNVASSTKSIFASNKISTTKYNIISFLPKGLYEQFRRVANLYFAFHAALSLTPVSPVNPVTTITPLVFVIGVAMLKEGIEDRKRGKADKEINNSTVEVIAGQTGTLQEVRWKNVKVGDIVRVPSDTSFPADLLFLWSSNTEGTCYVETMNIDGETNLKLKNAVDATKDLDEPSLGGFDGTVECEQPNPSIYTFAGNLVWHGQVLNLGPENLLLRGSDLRNTRYIYGLVIFTGFDTKIMMNATSPPSKRSTMERRLDKIIYFQLLLLITMCLITCITFATRLSNQFPDLWYMRPDDTHGSDAVASALFNPDEPAVAGLLNFFTSLVLYGYFIPISLYVTIEVVKVIQALFINQDLHMYHPDTDRPAAARTSNLNEELGQVQTILSDKTGTLTRNQMEFFKCSIAGVSYGVGITEVEKAAAELRGRSMSQQELAVVPDKPLEQGFNLRDARLENSSWLQEANADVIHRFMEVLAVCHTAIPEGEAIEDRIRYMAESPDEAAFVVAAKRFGFFFYKRITGAIFVKVKGRNGEVRDCKYELLNTLEFSSKRRRMSVVVRDPEGQLLLLSKGADSVIFERLAPSGREFQAVTSQHMTDYGEAGLRTLALAYARLDEDKYREWQKRWVEAKANVRSALEIAKKLEALAEELEGGLTLVGATAIEDKLQVGVPQTIDRLARAGIKLWVLTGDKLETAINIGYACSLLRHNMAKHIVTLESHEVQQAEASRDQARIREVCLASVKRQLEAGVDALEGRTEAAAPGGVGGYDSHALIVDGKSIGYIMDEEAGLKDFFLEFALRCESVICCRVSPKQKAQVTWLVKDGAKEICLSVGDGANDVGMIQAANIGVGISGVEGQQAVMASDFSIAQFRFLERLVLVHGGWCYNRIARLITYFFYKNFVFGFTIFFFNAFALFSGQAIYHDWYLSIYNVIFTCLPIGVVAVLDQDVSPSYRIRFPGLYQAGQRNRNFSFLKIVTWLLNGLLQSAIIFTFVMAAYWITPDRHSGRMPGLYAIGTVMYTTIVITVNLQLGLAISYWTWLHHFTIWGSISIWFVFLLFFGALPAAWATQGRKLFVDIVAPSPTYWLLVLLGVVAALLPDYALRSYRRAWWPSDDQIVQEVAQRERKQNSSRPLAQQGVNGGGSTAASGELEKGSVGVFPLNSKDDTFLQPRLNSFHAIDNPFSPGRPAEHNNGELPLQELSPTGASRRGSVNNGGVDGVQNGAALRTRGGSGAIDEIELSPRVQWSQRALPCTGAGCLPSEGASGSPEYVVMPKTGQS